MKTDPDPELVYEVLERIERRTHDEECQRRLNRHFWIGLGLLVLTGVLVIAWALPGPKF